ncbi:MAG TPA: VCBS repeat-containing protein, partial [Acidimicrobiia bacterium]
MVTSRRLAAPRSQRDNVGCGMPVSRASSVADTAPGPSMRRTVRARTNSEYSMIRFRSRPRGGQVDAATTLTQGDATSPSFAAKVDFPTGLAPSSIAIGDLNGDNRPDLVVADSGSNAVSILLNITATSAATPSFATRVDFPAGAGPSSVAIGDLSGDGKPDLALANAGANTISVLRNTTTTNATTPSFAAKLDYSTGSRPVSVAIGDLNGDGKPDLTIANVNSSTVSALLN